MYKPQYIVIKGIGPIHDLKYDFQPGKSFLIQGRNLDNQGQRNNGVGKTFFIDSIAFAITGLTLSGRSIEEFIRDSSNEAYIEFSLTHSVKGHQFIIKRYLSRKKPQLIEFSLNGKEFHQDYADVNQRNEFIIKEIGISKEDLFQFFLISKDRYKPYFKFSDTDKKNVTARFSNASIVDEVQPLLEQEISGYQTKEREINIEVAKVSTQIQTFQQFISDLENKSSNTHKEELRKVYQERIQTANTAITNLQETIELQKATIKKFAQEIELYEAQIEQQKKNVSEIKDQVSDQEAVMQAIDEEFVKINSEIQKEQNVLKDQKRSKQKDLEEQTSLQGEYLQVIAIAKAKLESAISCPSCEHQFVLESELTVDELRNLLNESEECLKEVQRKRSEILKAIDSFAAKIQDKDQEILLAEKDKASMKAEVQREISNLELQERTIRNVIKNLEEKRENNLYQQKSATTIISNSSNKIQEAEKEIEAYEAKIEELDSLNYQQEIQEYYNLIKGLVEEKDKYALELTELQEKVAISTQWGLKYKAFKSYLVNQSLKHIQNLMNGYLNQMNTDLSVELEGFKQKGKKVSEKITETILRGGIPIGSYAKFSGGERGRIDVSSILANQTLINNKAENGLDLILVDEVLESVDEEGIKNIIQSMENIDKTMLLITQNEINTLPNQVITFEKQNGKLNIV